jgi:hypothetical protein
MLARQYYDIDSSYFLIYDFFFKQFMGKVMTSSSNIFKPARSKFDQVCETIESDPNYRILKNADEKFALMELIRKHRHSEHETLVISIHSETDSQRIYGISKTAFHVNDDGMTSQSVFDAVFTPVKKIVVSKKDGAVQIFHGYYGLPGCENFNTPLTDCKLEDFLKQPCILPPPPTNNLKQNVL